MIAAAVDIGTNSVKLIIGRREADGSVTVLHDTTAITRLGQGVNASGRLAPEAMERTLIALERFGQEARNRGAVRTAAVGTSALRDAANSAMFVQEAEQRLGGPVDVISGDREAELVFRAAQQEAQSLAPFAKTLVATDIGGGSTEIIIGRAGQILFRQSLQLGAVRLTEQMAARSTTDDRLFAAKQEIARHLAPVPKQLKSPVVIASGGTAANLAGMYIAATEPETPLTLERLHGVTLSHSALVERYQQLANLPLSERRTVPGLEPDRADVIVAGVMIQAEILAHLPCATLIVSVRGLRFGLLFELLSVV